jgi:hypothetical protein
MTLQPTINERRANLIAVYARKYLRAGQDPMGHVAEIIESANLSGDAIDASPRKSARVRNIIRRAADEYRRDYR